MSTLSVLFWLMSLPSKSELKAAAAQEQTQDVVELIETPPSVPMPVPRESHTRQQYNGSTNSIGRVFECQSNGQRVFSGRPCGVGAEVREIAAPNRMNRQDTRALYQPPPVSIQGQQSRARSGVSGGGNSFVCDSIDEDKKRINARMRQPYTSQEGELFRKRLRRLNERRWEARCGRSPQ